MSIYIGSVNTDISRFQTNEASRQQNYLNDIKNDKDNSDNNADNNYTAVSEYGDTLEISEESKKAAEDNLKQDEQIKQPEEETVNKTDDEDKSSDEITDLSSYSKRELENLYKNGEISKSDYQQELSRRELVIQT